MPQQNIFIHIGTLKTGSTSLQYFLKDHHSALLEQGFVLFPGAYIQNNHIELFLGTMNYERDSFAKLKMGLTTDAEYTEKVRLYIRSYLDNASHENIIFTTEGLSLLRYQEEVERLKSFFKLVDARITIIVYLRDKQSFLESYKKQILKVPGREFSNDKTSSLYVEPDTWLIDYDQLLAVFKNGFGEANVIVLDYDEELQSRKTIIPSFLEAVGISPSIFADIENYYLNRS